MTETGVIPETSRQNGPQINRAGFSAGWVVRSFHLVVLSGLAVAQPTLDLLSRHPEFFVAQGIRQTGILLVAAALLILPPLPFIAIEAALVRGPRRLWDWFHLGSIGFFSMLIALLALKRAGGWPVWAVLGCALVAAAVSVTLYRRVKTVRSFVSLMAIGLIVIPVAFLARIGAEGLLDTPSIEGMELPVLESSAPIVVIVFDEFCSSVLLDGNGEINRVRFPNIAALADTATWYPRAVSVAEYTMHAVPAILTGRRPRGGTLPTSTDHPRNLFTLFGTTHEIWAMESMTRLCPAEFNARGSDPVPLPHRVQSAASDLSMVYLHLVVPDSWVDRLPSISDTWGGFGDRATADVATSSKDDEEPLDLGKIGHRETVIDRRTRVRELIAALESCGDSKLYFAHLMLPHGPWDLLPTGHRYPAEKGAVWGVNREDNSWPEGEFLPLQAYQRYILQTMYVDRLVGEVRATLETRGVFDRSLIVLVADHGISFEPETRRRNVSFENSHEILPVPMLIKGPGQSEPKTLHQLVSLLDVLPTLVELLGVESPWEFDGDEQTTDGVSRSKPIEFMVEGSGFHEVLPKYLDGVDEAVNHRLRALGDGSDPLDLFRIGKYPELVGMSIEGIAQGEPQQVELGIDDALLYRSVNPEGATLPVFVQGSVKGRGFSGETHLAVAVNGTVGAVVSPHQDAADPVRFTALIPSAFLREGENEISVYRVETSAQGLMIHRLVDGG